MKNRRAAVSATALMCAAGLARAQSFSEQFESGSLPAAWIVHNQSNPIGTTQWAVGNNPDVPVHSGENAAYANFLNGEGLATISDWLLTNVVTIRNGDTLKFWTITNPARVYPDRLQVRISTSGSSMNTGSTEFDVGDFDTLLLDINPTYTTGGYPGVNTQFTIGPLSGLPVSGVTGRFAFRYFVESGGLTGPNSDVINIDDIDYVSSSDPVGACCFPDGTCTLLPSASCTGQGGSYGGNDVPCAAANCPQPPSGACCLPNGTCSMVTPVNCTAQSGIYSGDNVTCAAVNCSLGWAEVGDAGQTMATAQTVSGQANVPVSFISGNLAAATDVDMYKIQVCDSESFSASTVNATTAFDTQMFLFDSTGKGIAMDDDNPDLSGGVQSVITGQFIPAKGTYFLAISPYDNDPVTSGGLSIWDDVNPNGDFTPEWAPNGQGQANAMDHWDGGSADSAGRYLITLSGACYVAPGGPVCYANCDNSTSAPLLNANDFNCFLNKYAANDTYANCDGSTSAPLLNANDFNCFLNKYAAGCT